MKVEWTIAMKNKKEYIRDKRSPIPSSENISKVMSKNKGKNTKPELLLRKLLWENGLKGYRIHPKNIPGRPDICFISKKVAIFVNGCFWHRCPHCQYKLPKSNIDFWKAKFERNISRDKEKTEQLVELGWTVITVWECKLKNQELDRTIHSIIDKISAK